MKIFKEIVQGSDQWKEIRWGKIGGSTANKLMTKLDKPVCEVAEFNATLFGGTTYRVAACSGLKDGQLEFSIFDKQRNLLFSNIEHKNAPYWDFKLTSTLDCTIEAQLIDANAQSGCAVLLISFKQ